MTTWRDRHDPFPATEGNANTMSGPRREDGRTFASIPQSQLIEMGGVFLGIAVEHELGVRFIAMDAQVTDMDQSIWPTLKYARRSAQQLFRSSRVATPR
jgi:hypothetical protein